MKLKKRMKKDKTNEVVSWQCLLQTKHRAKVVRNKHQYLYNTLYINIFTRIKKITVMNLFLKN